MFAQCHQNMFFAKNRFLYNAIELKTGKLFLLKLHLLWKVLWNRQVVLEKERSWMTMNYLPEGTFMNVNTWTEGTFMNVTVYETQIEVRHRTDRIIFAHYFWKIVKCSFYIIIFYLIYFRSECLNILRRTDPMGHWFVQKKRENLFKKKLHNINSPKID